MNPEELWKEIVCPLTDAGEASLNEALARRGLQLYDSSGVDVGFPEGPRSPVSDTIRDWIDGGSGTTDPGVAEAIRVLHAEVLSEIDASWTVFAPRFGAFRAMRDGSPLCLRIDLIARAPE